MSEKIYRVQMNSKGMPNFSTAEEIIRCGECKHWRTKYFKDGHGWCEWHINETKADDFCSYGERSE